ncbi:MAG: DUF5615 family PIN-like protein [candidate division WOR-3 bacterium]
MAGLAFLADEIVERGIVDHLLSAGYNVKWVRDCAPAASDDLVTRLARKEKRILVTNDKDFGELTFIQKKHRAALSCFVSRDKVPLRRLGYWISCWVLINKGSRAILLW